MRSFRMVLDKFRRTLAGSLVLVFFVSIGVTHAQEGGDVVPWPRQYKIKPDQKARLTAADVVGPDGIVYPNWTRCGVQGEIPASDVVARIEDYGAKADDDLDDSEALQKACDAVGRTGGVVLIGEGTYYLDQPVTVRNDRVVMRGKGQSQTRLIFRYTIPEPSVTFFWPPANAKVGRNTRIEMHCRPSGLAKMTLMVDETPIGTWTRGRHSGNTFAYARYGRDISSKSAGWSPQTEGHS